MATGHSDLSPELEAGAVPSKAPGRSSAPVPPQEPAGGDCGGYMHAKRLKLQNQFNEISASRKSSIFKGVTVYVNGWTDPTADELKLLIHAHGGKYVYNFYSAASVTHIIASNLPNSKIKNIGDKIVCSPDWIVDSVAAGYCLPYQKYQAFSRHSSAQQRLDFTVEAEPQDAGVSASGADGNDKEAPSTSTLNTATHATADISAVQSHANSHSKGAELVNEFFSHSRLHHLSTWSIELKRFTAEMVTKITPKHPVLPHAVSLRAKNERCIVHIDLDCFFVSVSIRDKPHLKGKPVAVTHAKLPPNQGACGGPADQVYPKHLLESRSDIASCSYEARACGVRNGMLVGQALKRCPTLQLVSYDFDNYRKVAQIFYEVLLHYSSTVEAVSCDETYMELTDYVENFGSVESIIRELRSEIHSKTNCTVSAGISHNMLLARMATRVAKPDGQLYVSIQEADTFIATQSVRDLPGVGYSLNTKLQDLGILTCQELRKLPVAKLKTDFGSKTGQMLFQFARGLDDRPLKVNTERKSVSVDMNFGIRLSDISEAESLIQSLSDELEKRADDASVLGGTISLKLKIRSQSAPQEAPKYLGHGQCDNVTRSVTLLQPTRSSSEVARLSKRLLAQIKPTASDIRGVGIQLTKLISSDTCARDSGSSNLGSDLRKMLSSAAMSKPAIPHSAVMPADLTSGACAVPDQQSACSQIEPLRTATITDDSFAIDLPPSSQLDSSVLEALPLELRQRIIEGYAGKGYTGAKTITSAVVKAADACDQIPRTTPLSVETAETVALKGALDDGIVIGNEETFLIECHQYIDRWVMQFIEGPKDEDVAKVCDYLLKLLQANLEMLSLFLKHFRRVLCRFALTSWYPSFNTILATIQSSASGLYGGVLPIPKL